MYLLSTRLRNHSSLIGASVLYLLLVILFLKFALYQTGGTQIFLVDDAYIHASLGKNLLNHGVLSVSPTGFSSASSSISWPLLIAFGFAIFGVHLWVLLALNLLFALLSLFVADALLRDLAGEGAHLERFFVLSLIVVGGSLVVLTFVGMEHNLQVLTILLLVRSGVSVLANHGNEVWLYLSGVAAILVRYEAGFAIAALFILLVLNHRALIGFLLAGFSLIPIIISGIFNLRHGALFLPDSVLLKSRESSWWRPFPTFVGAGGYLNLMFFVGGAFLLILLLITLFDWLGATTFLKAANIRFVTYFTSMLLLLHYEFAKTGWATRYEAYLVVLAILTLGATAILWAKQQESQQRRFDVLFGAPLLMTLIIMPRIFLCAGTMMNAAEQIYSQQFQMARFLAAMYPGETVAVNDIGIVSYWEPRRIVDVFGLASPEIARLKLSGRFNSSALAKIVSREGVHVAIVYPEWLNQNLPDTWTLVGKWQLPPHILSPVQVVGGASVSFYAPHPNDISRLRQALTVFAPCLPHGIVQSGYKIEGNRSCVAASAPTGWIW